MSKMKKLRQATENADECRNAIEMLRNLASSNDWSWQEECQMLDTADMIQKKEERYRRLASSIERDVFAVMT